MLSRETFKLLKWLSHRDDESFSVYELCKTGFCVTIQDLNWLYDHDYLTRYESDEFYDSDAEDPPYMYGISQGGKAELNEYRRSKREEMRGWMTTTIAVAAFILSIISLILQSRK
jgi:hypothetical protein